MPKSARPDWILFTDLDGTLLDHHSYSWAAAEPALARLAAARIPVILNTSKTFAEVVLLHQALGLTTPFVVENGAAIYLPLSDYPEPPQAIRHGNWSCVPLAEPRERWLALIARLPAELRRACRGFADLSSRELAALTGLSQDQAERAKLRQFTEPLQAPDDPATAAQLVEALRHGGAQVVRGGRFLHVSGACDKAVAQQWLVDYLRRPGRALASLSLGDSDNDSAMLSQADIACQIRSPKHPFPALARGPGPAPAWQSEQYGPSGWNECVQRFFREFYRP